MKYESAILKRLINTYGVVGNPRYISEIIKEFIVQGKECFPNLFTYQADWLAHIDEFGLSPSYTVSYTGQSIYAPNTLERPVKRAILTGQTLVNLLNDYNNGQYRSSLVGETDFITLLNMNDKKVYFDTANEDGSYKKSIVINPYSVYTKQFSPTDKFRLINLTEAHGWTSENYTECRIVMLKGDYTNVDIPYFTGMQSVKMPVLTTTGKNLFDKNKLEKGEFHGNGEPAVNDVRCRTSDFIQVKGGSKITLSKSTNEWFRVFGYDNNKNFVSNVINKKSSSETFAIPSNVCFIKIKFDYTLDIAMVDNIQLEVGDKATTYKPYKSNILSTPSNLELRGIGDVKDTLDCLTGQVTERVREIVLNGTEEWSINNSNNGGFYSCSTTTYVGVPNGKVICEQLPSVTSTKTEGVMMGVTSGKLMVSFNRDKTGVTSLETFKAKLAELQLKVCYENEKTIKTVELTILDQNGQNVKQLMSFNGGTHFNTGSLEGSPLPTVSVSVETDLEETLMVCSLEGNTM